MVEMMESYLTSTVMEAVTEVFVRIVRIGCGKRGLARWDEDLRKLI